MLHSLRNESRRLLLDCIDFESFVCKVCLSELYSIVFARLDVCVSRTRTKALRLCQHMFRKEMGYGKWSKDINRFAVGIIWWSTLLADWTRGIVTFLCKRGNRIKRKAVERKSHGLCLVESLKWYNPSLHIFKMKSERKCKTSLCWSRRYCWKSKCCFFHKWAIVSMPSYEPNSPRYCSAMPFWV